MQMKKGRKKQKKKGKKTSLGMQSREHTRTRCFCIDQLRQTCRGVRPHRQRLARHPVLFESDKNREAVKRKQRNKKKC